MKAPLAMIREQIKCSINFLLWEELAEGFYFVKSLRSRLKFPRQTYFTSKKITQNSDDNSLLTFGAQKFSSSPFYIFRILMKEWTSQNSSHENSNREFGKKKIQNGSEVMVSLNLSIFVRFSNKKFWLGQAKKAWRAPFCKCLLKHF